MVTGPIFVAPKNSMEKNEKMITIYRSIRYLFYLMKATYKLYDIEIVEFGQDK